METDEIDFDGWYNDWYHENEKDLMVAFQEEYPDEWIEFLDMKRATLEQDDFDYWRVLFCEEELPNEFVDFCEEKYDEYKDELKMEARLE